MHKRKPTIGWLLTLQTCWEEILKSRLFVQKQQIMMSLSFWHAVWHQSISWFKLATTKRNCDWTLWYYWKVHCSCIQGWHELKIDVTRYELFASLTTGNLREIPPSRIECSTDACFAECLSKWLGMEQYAVSRELSVEIRVGVENWYLKRAVWR